MSADSLDLQTFFPYKLSRLVNELSAGLLRTYASRFSLNVSQWRMLSAAARLAPTTVTELTQYSGMDKVTVSRATKELVDKGLLARVVDDYDRRKATLTLTARGRRTYEQIAPLAIDYQDRVLEVLAQADVIALDRILDSLIESAVAQRRTDVRSPPEGNGSAKLRTASRRREDPSRPPVPDDAQ